jgi:hypothetical protein
MDFGRYGASVVLLGAAALAALVLIDNVLATEGFRAYARGVPAQRADDLAHAVRASNTVRSVLRWASLGLVAVGVLGSVLVAWRRHDAWTLVSATAACLLLYAADHATIEASTETVLRTMPLRADAALEPVPFAHDYVTESGTHCLAYVSQLHCEGSAPAPYAAARIPQPPVGGRRHARHTLSVAFDARLRAPEMRRFLRAARARGYRALVVHGGIPPGAYDAHATSGFLRVLVPERVALHFLLDAEPDAKNTRAVIIEVRDDDTARSFLLRARGSGGGFTQRFLPLDTEANGR